jgi:hypothetical protein
MMMEDDLLEDPHWVDAPNPQSGRSSSGEQVWFVEMICNYFNKPHLESKVCTYLIDDFNAISSSMHKLEFTASQFPNFN